VIKIQRGGSFTGILRVFADGARKSVNSWGSDDRRVEKTTRINDFAGADFVLSFPLGRTDDSNPQISILFYTQQIQIGNSQVGQDFELNSKRNRLRFLAEFRLFSTGKEKK
jgi:hypothetical protein